MHESQVSHKHAHTVQQIFQHPPSHNLEWHSIVAMVKDSGTVDEGGSGQLTFTLNGITEVFHPAHGKKEVSDPQQVLAVRHFLERAGFHKDGTIGQAAHTADPEDAPEKEQHPHDHGHTNAEQNRRAELQIKAQMQEQLARNAFEEGSAQAHQQGDRQK